MTELTALQENVAVSAPPFTEESGKILRTALHCQTHRIFTIVLSAEITLSVRADIIIAWIQSNLFQKLQFLSQGLHTHKNL
jgi:hypothetical protein